MSANGFSRFLFYMALSKDKKANILDKLRQVVKSSKSLVFVNFHGLTVNLADELRSGLRGQDVSYTVAKKTLVKLALEEGKLDGEAPDLPGEIAIAYGDDLILPAKGIYEFSQKNPKLVSIVGGVFEGRFMNAEEMNEVAKIPGQKVLYGQFVNLLNSPIQGLVIALDQIATKQEA